eukprot:TRINITY_DN14333_c0_g1_i1.p1 TRINITY_DN14333_c0_g1~~TRINITY_DN14333_c0_g1_i1.p1  ORF type:complete len:148 (-),score=29.96 TRINITY_DN14333_c0_g1_i1:185-628(-)
MSLLMPLRRVLSNQRVTTNSMRMLQTSFAPLHGDDGHVHSATCGHHHDDKNAPLSKDRQILNKLRATFPDAHVDVADVSGGCGASFSILVVSPEFEAKSKLQRQRLVNAAVSEFMEGIHAIQQYTLSPDEWKARLDAQAKHKANAAS